MPPRALLWTSTDGPCRLEELVHPWHLVVEDYHLGYGVADHVPPSSAAVLDLSALSHWRRVAVGALRLFSFGNGRAPLCTLHVALPGPSLVAAEPRHPGSITGGEPFYPALVEAIRHLDAVSGPLAFAGRPPAHDWPPPPPAADIEVWAAWFFAQRLLRRRFPGGL